MLIIPAVDLKDGKVVRLYRGEFDKVTVYSDDPVKTALNWQDLGAKLIHIVDLEGALAGELKNKAVIKDIIGALQIQTEVSGGFRKREDIEEFIRAGATRIILGSKLRDDISFLEDICKIYPDRLAVSLDARNFKQDPEGKIILNLSTQGWQVDKQISLNELLEKIARLGIRFINYTDISRDGTLTGVNFDNLALIIGVVSKYENFNLIVSGGISSIEDVTRIKNLGAIYGVIIGKALYENRIDFKQALKVVSG